MYKKTKKLIALFLAFASVLALSGCSDSFEAKWEGFWEGRQDTTTTEGVSESKTHIPVEAGEIVNYFNSLVKNVKSVRPKFSWSEKGDVSEAKSSNQLLADAIPTIKGLIFNKEESDHTYGEALSEYYQLSGNVNSDAVSFDDVLSAQCTQVDDNYEILITLKDEASKNVTTLTAKYFELTNKSDVLAEFQKAKDYLTVSDYDEFLTGSTIKCVVSRLTDEVSSITYTKSAQITTQVTGAGELTQIGMVDLSFIYTDTISYSGFDFADPATAAAEE